MYFYNCSGVCLLDFISLIKFKIWKASWIMLVGFLVFFFLDIYSTFQNGALTKYLEVNPLVVFTGSWIILICFNLFSLWFMLKIYDNKKPFIRYLAVSFFVWSSFLRLITIINNFKAASRVQAGEITLEAAQSISTVAKVTYHGIFTMILFHLPMLLTLLVYLIYTLDNKVVRHE